MRSNFAFIVLHIKPCTCLTRRDGVHFKVYAPMRAAQIDRMSANFLCRVSKGRLSAFGCVSFVTFLWQNKEKLINYSLSLNAAKKSVHHTMGRLFMHNTNVFCLVMLCGYITRSYRKGVLRAGRGWRLRISTASSKSRGEWACRRFL